MNDSEAEGLARRWAQRTPEARNTVLEALQAPADLARLIMKLEGVYGPKGCLVHMRELCRAVVEAPEATTAPRFVTSESVERDSSLQHKLDKDRVSQSGAERAPEGRQLEREQESDWGTSKAGTDRSEDRKD